MICSFNKLHELPLLPRCRSLSCDFNELIELPLLPRCERLTCKNNQLVRLPDLLKCISLNCKNNRLISLPDLPLCKTLNCINNAHLSNIPYLPNCKSINSFNSGLYQYSLEYIKTHYTGLCQYYDYGYNYMCRYAYKKRYRQFNEQIKYSPKLPGGSMGIEYLKIKEDINKLIGC